MNIKLKEGVYVAKDRNGTIGIFKEKPTKFADQEWDSDGQADTIYPDSGLYDIPDLGPWEDSLHVMQNDELVKVIDRPALAVDTPVWVRDGKECKWARRHFHSWNIEGNIVCWEDGKTSHTASNMTWWSDWALEDPDKEEN